MFAGLRAELGLVLGFLFGGFFKMRFWVESEGEFILNLRIEFFFGNFGGLRFFGGFLFFVVFES